MELRDTDIEQLRAWLMSHAWKNVMRILIAERGHAATQALIQDVKDRRDPFNSASDDHLRGAINTCAWLLSMPDKIVEVYDLNRRRDELDRQAASQQDGEPQPLTTANP
jgi:hypothetical protein